MADPLYAPLDDSEATAEPEQCLIGCLVGVAFALIFEAIAGVSVLIVIASYHFLRGWLGSR